MAPPNLSLLRGFVPAVSRVLECKHKTLKIPRKKPDSIIFFNKFRRTIHYFDDMAQAGRLAIEQEYFVVVQTTRTLTKH